MTCKNCERKKKLQTVKTETQIKQEFSKKDLINSVPVNNSPVLSKNLERILSKPISINKTNIIPKKLLFKNFQSPGDILMLTAAVRDLHKAYPNQYITRLDTSCKQIWENNPYVSKFDTKKEEFKEIKCEYNLVHKSNRSRYHFIHGFHKDLEEKLNLKIPVTDFKADIHLSQQEKSWVSQIEEMDIKDNFWIIVAGGKLDFTRKWTNPDYYQDVVDHFKGKITFVQTGQKDHFHTPLKGTINLIGKTDLRQFIRLVHHSVGVLCPVTFAMHAAAGVPTKPNRPPNRACVVIAGGREPAQWEAYPHHRFLSNNGALSCCLDGGCWKSRCTLVGDGDKKDTESVCLQPVQVTLNKVKIPTDSKIKPENLRIGKCMDMIKPKDIIRAIESYYEGGVLSYGSCIPDNVPEKAKPFLDI
jgi:ADP-heptose:LPS heptosyltransferase